MRSFSFLTRAFSSALIPFVEIAAAF
ncbi:hypothetical protein D047_0086A, partial [Vibrio parahaemolyticus VPTS-2010_2]